MSTLATYGMMLVQNGGKLTYRQGGGQFGTVTWLGEMNQLGTNYNAMCAAAVNDPTVIEINFSNEGGRARIDITTGNEAAMMGMGCSNGALEIWELMPNEFEKRVEQAAYFTTTAAADIANAYAAYNAGVTSDGVAGAAPYNLSGKGLDLFHLLLKGTQQFLEAGYVLRQTKVVSGVNAVAASFASVNRVDGSIPYSGQNIAIGNALPQFDNGSGGLAAGEWLKRCPMVRRITHTKWQVQLEWWGAYKWRTILYGGTATP